MGSNVPTLLANIRLGLMWVPVTSTLAYQYYSIKYRCKSVIYKNVLTLTMEPSKGLY
jgi:hypothetical protein